MAILALRGGAAIYRTAAVAAGVVVGALTSPFVAVYTVLLGIPAAAVAWAIGGRRGAGSAHLVAAAALGLVVGASLYFLLAVVVTVAARG